MKKLSSNLTGAEIILRLQKGHAVRRAAWVKGFFIRICNEQGYNEKGNAIFDDKTSIYTTATNGYFLHIGNSSQPLKKQRTPREGEGLSMLFESDWEDYGWITREEFDNLTNEVKEAVRKTQRKYLSEWNRSQSG